MQESAAGPARPENVGILAMEVYFPNTAIKQADLEVFDGVSTGKYTIGLGQQMLAYCTDREDVVSISLTVVQSLFEKYDIDPRSIGRLDVGSETILDKSKSIKSSLMALFEESGNSDVQGIDSLNACYAGTAALFNAINWVESSGWDGRYALVVAADIAVYAEGPARPTSGAGAVAMLVGRDAPLALEAKYTASHMANTWDFYKPKLDSEYPVVDGKLTQMCFLSALDKAYSTYCSKYQKRNGGEQFSLADAEHVVFHAPYNKLVQKSFARLVYNDFLRLNRDDAESPLYPFRDLTSEESYSDRALEKAAMTASAPSYKDKVLPSTLLPTQCGNMYTAALYGGLASLVDQARSDLVGKRVLMFSYGSGLACSLFSFRVREARLPLSVDGIASAVNIEPRLKQRQMTTPEEFDAAMKQMEQRYGKCGFEPTTSVDSLAPGTYYLVGIDDKYRRTYLRKPKAVVAENDSNLSNGAVNGSLQH
eukprot:jgi/Chlat1/1455/Chrsp12S02007